MKLGRRVSRRVWEAAGVRGDGVDVKLVNCGLFDALVRCMLRFLRSMIPVIIPPYMGIWTTNYNLLQDRLNILVHSMLQICAEPRRRTLRKIFSLSRYLPQRRHIKEVRIISTYPTSIQLDKGARMLKDFVFHLHTETSETMVVVTTYTATNAVATWTVHTI